MDTLGILNEQIENERGSAITAEDLWIDADVDSFGTTIVFLEMDERYECFDNEWFKAQDWYTLTIKAILERAENEGLKL